MMSSERRLILPEKRRVDGAVGTIPLDLLMKLGLELDGNGGWFEDLLVLFESGMNKVH
jgi:hypothetical protein